MTGEGGMRIGRDSVEAGRGPDRLATKRREGFIRLGRNSVREGIRGLDDGTTISRLTLITAEQIAGESISPFYIAHRTVTISSLTPYRTY